MTVVARWLTSFGRFWWEFLVGDTPELLFAVLLVIGLAFALKTAQAAAILAVILVAVGCLGLSTWRGRKRHA